MKKILFGFLILMTLVCISTVAQAAGTSQFQPVSTAVGYDPSSNQITCTTDASGTVLVTANHTAVTQQGARTSVMFERLDSGTNTVYIKPTSALHPTTITTGNAPFKLKEGVPKWFDRSAGVEWRCITDGSTATIGVLEER